MLTYENNEVFELFGEDFRFTKNVNKMNEAIYKHSVVKHHKNIEIIELMETLET